MPPKTYARRVDLRLNAQTTDRLVYRNGTKRTALYFSFFWSRFVPGLHTKCAFTDSPMDPQPVRVVLGRKHVRLSVPRCRRRREIFGRRTDGVFVGKPVHVQGAPPGRRHVPGQGVQLSREAVRMEMFRLPFHRVSTHVVYVYGRIRVDRIRDSRPGATGFRHF